MIIFFSQSNVCQTKFPNMLKMVDISTIFKRGDPKIPKKYRPIAVLHNISKVFERVIFNRITDCTKNNLLPCLLYTSPSPRD